MLRHIRIGDQITDDADEFAFFDTVTSSFVRVGDSYVWGSRAEFDADCAAEGVSEDRVKRLVQLLPRAARMQPEADEAVRILQALITAYDSASEYDLDERLRPVVHHARDWLARQ